jgi:beta-galactosidase
MSQCGDQRRMGRCLLPAFVAILAVALPSLAIAQETVKPSFVVEGDHFALNGKPVQILSGEMHYARVPHEYWRTRMLMAKAMGLNTISTYIFWNIHEPHPGVYDFSGDRDIAAFVRLAQEEHLNVLLRVGPYSCGEWEWGGLPSWLLADPKMSTALRTTDPAFMVPVERWIMRLAKEIAPLQVGRGGPVIGMQIENEYGNFAGNYGAEKGYMPGMRDLFVRAGFTDSLLYTVDPFRSLPNGSLDDVVAGANFGTGVAEQGLTALAKFRPKQPLFAAEYWPGWFDLWGHPHETRPTDKQVEDLNYILSHHAALNIYMFHGGTTFGFMTGGRWIGGNYVADVTSYDYDAPLNEAGHPTPKFYAYREVLAKYAGEPLPAVLEPPPVIAVPGFAMEAATPLWAHLPTPRASENPLTMEAMGQAYGYVLYRKQLEAAVNGPLVLDEVHDYARVYVDGKLAGTIDRRLHQDRIDLTASKGSRLDILVENSGRVYSTKMMRGEVKGITHGVSLAGAPLTGWQNYSLPMEDAGTIQPDHRAGKSAPISGPHFSFAHFALKQTGDTFLDVSALGKGALWINGHALGRFWNVGPQMTLYVPGPWLRAGRNDVVAFDLFDASSEAPMLVGRLEPILDAPTPGATSTAMSAPKTAAP